jgi:hypothetical protein
MIIFMEMELPEKKLQLFRHSAPGILLLVLLLYSSFSWGQEGRTVKKTKKVMRAYSFRYKDPDRISDSSWLTSEARYTRAGDDIVTILYQRNGDIWKVLMKDIDSLHKPRSFILFNNKGVIVDGRKRAFYEDTILMVQRPAMLDPAMECLMRAPHIICKCNENGDIISYELTNEKRRDMIIIKERYEYEYWEDK